MQPFISHHFPNYWQESLTHTFTTIQTLATVFNLVLAQREHDKDGSRAKRVLNHLQYCHEAKLNDHLFRNKFYREAKFRRGVKIIIGNNV